MTISFVMKSAPIVALYCLENLLFTYCAINDVFPTLHRGRSSSRQSRPERAFIRSSAFASPCARYSPRVPKDDHLEQSTLRAHRHASTIVSHAPVVVQIRIQSVNTKSNRKRAGVINRASSIARASPRRRARARRDASTAVGVARARAPV
jgi:hypothetical protein